MEALATWLGIYILLVTPMAWFAYKHPRPYRTKVAPTVIGLCMLLATSILGYMLGFSSGRLAEAGSDRPPMISIFMLVAALLLTGALLTELPRVLDESGESEDDQDSEARPGLSDDLFDDAVLPLPELDAAEERVIQVFSRATDSMLLEDYIKREVGNMTGVQVEAALISLRRKGWVKPERTGFAHLTDRAIAEVARLIDQP